MQSEGRRSCLPRHQVFQELRLQRVTRSFGSTIALNGLNLTIQSGEFIALLGPSGCGKSTALNCLAGLLPLTDGSIWLDQQRIDQLRPERRGFGLFSELCTFSAFKCAPKRRFRFGDARHY